MPHMVVIPKEARPPSLVQNTRVHSIVCHRAGPTEEEYLVRWTGERVRREPPLSWHTLTEVSNCLPLLQDYLESRYRAVRAIGAKYRKKRKAPDYDLGEDGERRASARPAQYLSPISRTPSTDRSILSEAPLQAVNGQPHGTNSLSSNIEVNVWNGKLEPVNGYITCKWASTPDIASINIKDIPTSDMAIAAYRAKVSVAELLIRAAYVRKLEAIPGRKVWLSNTIDGSSPPLRFKFVDNYVLRAGVFRADPATQIGCQSCKPNMGRSIGCEYTRTCECLEYAAVDEARCDESQRQKYLKAQRTGGSTMGLPKKFPYYASEIKVQKPGTLVPFYLNSRRPIYECNANCRCGNNCRNRLVQFGRTVELEIFKTTDGRSWGLRCKQDLYEGQFIDTYRGEIITDEEATEREESSSKAKASYLYSLDKFAESENLSEEDIYVVDGEFMGGPTKFMNHSCDPNCRQYTVSYNKHDARVYDIAFFACKDIPRGTELTFDYLDKEEDDKIEEPGEGAVPCLCGSQKCRKWLWT